MRELVALIYLTSLVSSDCFVALPRGAMGLSAVCDFGISLSYSLTSFGNAHSVVVLLLSLTSYSESINP